MSGERRTVLDVAPLESFGFGSRGVGWWGVNCFIAIETTMLVLCLASYFYLPSQAPDWRTAVPLPPLGPATLNTAVLLLSVLPMVFTERAARRCDRAGVQSGLLACLGLGLMFCALRVVELRALPFRWDDNAYASVVWTTIGLHAGHLFAEVLETIVIAAVFFRGGELETKYFVDAEDNAFYWYFIVAVWLPVYAVLYLSPRFL
jgi:cytochrome c oxidase subunit III